VIAVLDTNVFISAFVFGGNPRRVVQLAEFGAFRLAVSKAVQLETERVLLEKFRWPRARMAEACEPVWDVAAMTEPRTVISASRDDDDNRILECAIDARAAAIVTGDQDLLRLDPFRGIRIVTPADFLRRRMWTALPRRKRRNLGRR
jgi:putative PIN family toxin of toxin-antitoxin system